MLEAAVVVEEEDSVEVFDSKVANHKRFVSHERFV